MSYKEEYAYISISFNLANQPEKELYEQISRLRAIKGLSWKNLLLEGLMYIEPKLIDYIIYAKVKGSQKPGKKG